MKKIFLAFIAIITAIVFLAGCSSTATLTDDIFNGTKDVYGFEAVSSITLLGTMNSETTAPLLAKEYDSTTLTRLSTNEVTEVEIEQINKYLAIMEQMLSDEEPINVTNEASDRSEFTNKMIITTKDLNQNVYTYVLYYNETALVDEEELADDNEENEDLEKPEKEKEEDEEEEDETESQLEGIMVIGDKEYVVSGKKELEEDEMKVEFKATLDQDNWVRVQQETENGETQFKYTISENGVISQTKIKVEKEDNETKLMLTFRQDNVERKYQFKEEIENEQKIIHIKVVDETISANMKVYVHVDPETNEVTYEYKYVETGKSYIKDRQNAHDKKDDEEHGEQNRNGEGEDA